VTERITTILSTADVEVPYIESSRGQWEAYLTTHVPPAQRKELPADFGLCRLAGRHRADRLAIEAGADPCTYRYHDVDHPATVQLTPDPDPELSWAHTDQLTVCTCCAYVEGHLFEEMTGQVRRGGDVVVELRQADGSWK